MADERRWAIVAALLLGVFAVVLAVTPKMMPDFFIYRLGSALAARGETPYDLAKIRAHFAQQFPDSDPKQKESTVNNCGYFLPPQAVVVFLPFAMLPFATAKVAWALVTVAAGFAIALLPAWNRRPDEPLARGLVPKLVPFLLLLNFLAIAVLQVGQTTFVCAGCVAAGLWCFDRPGRGWFWFGVLLWAVPFVKPHVALPLIPLAWYLGGWKRAAAVVAVVIALNLIGATLAGGSPLYLKNYLEYLPTAHKEVMFNRVELNPEITSWNRLLLVAGGRLIEQDAITTLASYLVWGGLVLGRVALAGTRPSAAWALAATVAGAAVCPQVLGYESLVLVLAVPWICDLFADGRRGQGWFAVAVLLSMTIPYPWLAAVGFDFHRPLAAALFALAVLVGPPARATPLATSVT